MSDLVLKLRKNWNNQPALVEYLCTTAGCLFETATVRWWLFLQRYDVIQKMSSPCVWGPFGNSLQDSLPSHLDTSSAHDPMEHRVTTKSHHKFILVLYFKSKLVTLQEEKHSIRFWLCIFVGEIKSTPDSKWNPLVISTNPDLRKLDQEQLERFGSPFSVVKEKVQLFLFCAVSVDFTWMRLSWNSCLQCGQGSLRYGQMLVRCSCKCLLCNTAMQPVLVHCTCSYWHDFRCSCREWTDYLSCIDLSQTWLQLFEKPKSDIAVAMSKTSIVLLSTLAHRF